MSERAPTEARTRLEEFLRAEGGSLAAMFRRALGDPELAMDLLQETMMEAWRHIETYDTERPFRNWVFRIAENRLRNRIRRKRLEAARMRPLGDWEPAVAELPEAGVMASERQALLEKALLGLPYEERLCVILRYQEELSVSDIGEILGATPNAVSLRLFHAREKLKSLLGERRRP